MQMKLVEQSERQARGRPEAWGPPERRQVIHKRIERWIRLQTFVYGLPEDFSYAVRLFDREGVSGSDVLVKVGWMSWFGTGLGTDRQQALALALLEAEDALSANSSRVFLHRASRTLRAFLSFFSRLLRGRKAASPALTALAEENEDERKLLAS